LLRADGKSYVIDVNGWSFVKDNNEYYDQAAKILKELFVQEKARKEGKLPVPQEPEPEAGADPAQGIQRKGTGGHRATLKGLFHSPSLTKLAGHHHQHRTGAGSPEIGSLTLPISSPPSMENPLGILGRPIATSQPHLPPPAISEANSVESRYSMTPSIPEKSPIPPPASKAQWKLKGMVSVIRHADRTPKQKFKFTFHTKPFVDLLKGHQEEVLLIGEAALDSVVEAVQTAMKEGIEDPDKLKLLRSSLLKKGAWVGTKVQIKPMFRQKKKEELAVATEPSPQEAQLASADVNPAGEVKEVLDRIESPHDSTPDVTLSRISAKEKDLVLDKLQLIVKWGGEPTHSARYQAKDLGDNLRSDLMIMNRECVEDVTIYSSSERRVTTSAQIFAAAFLGKKDLPSDFITVRKDLLDDSNAAKDEMDKVKKKLKQLLREGDKAPPQFAWPDDTPEPFIVVRTVVELMKFHRNVMHQNFKKLQSGAVSSLAAVINPANLDGSNLTTSTSSSSLSQAQAISNIQPRWCSGEDAELFRERWEKLFKEFCDAEKVDPSKISELYDTMKFDALHNRQFLEWVFTPDASMLEEDSIADSTRTSPLIGPGTNQSSRRTSRSELRDSLSIPPPADKSEKPHLAQRIGFRRRSEHERPNPTPKSKTTSQLETTENTPESYFHLYKGISPGQSKAKFDARLSKLRELYKLCKVLFDYIGPQEYGISPSEKLEIGLLTSLPLLKEIVADLEEVQACEGAKSFWYFTKESHIYTLLNCILEGGVKTKIERKKIPELDYLSQINFELYESQNVTGPGEEESFNYSIRISISPGCHTFDPLDV
jgi:inositol hexakisphosphate/diphosphoinositol-pentakisphosphate kinase